MRVCVGALRGAEEGRGHAPVVPSAQICAKVWCTVRTVATEASDFCKRSARVRPMSFVAYPRARVRVLDAKPERSESERLSARVRVRLPFLRRRVSPPLGRFDGVPRSA